ncbi:hypothetical protein BU074_13350, partial [Mammaliicoccus vitulinus]
SDASDPIKATDTTPPAKPVISTDLTGKAGTTDPVDVQAEPGTKVELFDKDGNKLGEAEAGKDGVAHVTPTSPIPEGNVTAKATDKAETPNTSEASEPITATAKLSGVKSPAYNELIVKPGVPTKVKQTGDNNLPPGTRFEIIEDNTPSDWDVTVDPDTGEVTVTSADDSEPGSSEMIPVNVIYPDGSTQEIPLVVTIQKNQAQSNEPGYDHTEIKAGLPNTIQ